MNNNSKKYIPIVVILVLIICVITGVILYTTLSNKDNSKNNSFLNDNIPNLNIDSELNIEEDDNTNDIINDELQEDINNSTEGDNQSSNNESNVDDNDTASKPNNNSNGSNKPSKNGTSTNKPNSQSKPNNNNSKPSDNTNTENKPINDKPATNEDKVENKEEDKEEEKEDDKYEDVLPNFPDPPPTPTQKELNDTYRNEIQNTYGIKIAYGEEMGGYLIGSYAPTKMTDDSEINEYLGRIEGELKKYPTGFFKEMKDYGMPLTLYIVKDIPGSDIAGLTDSQIYSNIIISIKSSFLFEKTLNHEMMHYIDAYLNSKMYPNTVDTEWNLLNPPGYSYGSFNTSYDYFPSMNKNAYFFSNYSQTNYKEDRATLFEDIMTRAYKRDCYNSGYTLYSKIQLLSKQIDDGFTTVNSSTIEFWEKFL